ncbi:MAG TPA: PadR family transcriptional regulator [Bradyrhizobium sp.]|jgi:DNA-binding PadR family transcriptional regulator|nr:PadR family transcriptional regulator [Bradyrhizobium sp.]
MALGDAILVCLTERPMTGYELAKTFDSSIGFFWKADHQQIYRELTRLRERGHVQAREVVQTGKPNKLVYTLTADGKAALRHWGGRPSSPPSIKDDMLVRLCALEAVEVEPMRADLMARLEHHRDRLSRYERVLKKRFPNGAESLDDTGKLLALHLGLRHERMVVEWCEEALQTLQPPAEGANVTAIGSERRGRQEKGQAKAHEKAQDKRQE